MRKTILTLAISLFTTLVYSQQNVTYEWANTVGSDTTDKGWNVVTDQFGYVYTIGQFQGTVVFDSSSVNSTLTSANPGIFIQKLDSSDSLIWVKQISGDDPLDDKCAMTIDSNANLYIYGLFTDTVDFDPGTGTAPLYGSSVSHPEGFILKLDSAGLFQWVKHLDLTTAGWNGIADRVGTGAIKLDGANNIIITAGFKGTVDFDPGTGIQTLSTQSNDGGNDAFTLKLDNNGNFLWVKQSKGLNASHGKGITSDQNGNIYTTGNFNGSVNFDPNVSNFTLTSNNNWLNQNNDIYIQKLTASGDFVWAKIITGNDELPVSDIEEYNGHIYIIGTTSDSTDFDPSLSTHIIFRSGSSNMAFIDKLDTNGAFVNATVFENNIGSPNMTANDLCIANGELYLVGSFNDLFDFNPGLEIDSLYPLSTNGYIIKLDNNGNSLWAKQIGITDASPTTTAGFTTVNGVDVDQYGNIYTTGSFSNDADFDPASNADLRTSEGDFDLFTHKLGICSPSFSVDTITTCDSYTWIDGNTYTSSNNTAIDTSISPSGCYAIATLDLSLNHSSTFTQTETACDAYTWIDGNTYTSNNNTATYTINNVAGCDSVISLDLTVYSTAPSVDVHTACNSFTWVNGVTYSSSNNTATDTTFYPGGCYAVTTLDLTINSATSYTEVVSACDSYTWMDGNTYTTSNNTATYITTNASGCDSIVKLNLTIGSTSSTTDTQFACDTFSWIDGNTYTIDNQTATDTFMSVNGCDSVVTLDLTMGYTSYYLDVIDACNAYTWMDGNTYTANNSSATYTITNTSGCDSVISLLLTVNTINTGTTVSGSTISSNAGNANFQWLDCENNYAPIPGANGATYTAPSNGSYAVQIIQDNCTDTSECVTINNIGIVENNLPDQFTVYPNPTSGNVTIAFDKAQQHIALRLLGVNGQLIETKTMSTATQLNVEITGASGVYFIEIIDDKNQKATIRVIKK